MDGRVVGWMLDCPSASFAIVARHDHEFLWAGDRNIDLLVVDSLVDLQVDLQDDNHLR